MSSWLTRAVWLGLLVVAFGSVCGQFWFRAKLSESRSILQDLESRKARRLIDNRMAYWARSEEQMYCSRIRTKLSEIKSIQEFPTGTGSRFICSELPGASQDEIRLGIFAPAGNHRLKLGFAKLSKAHRHAPKQEEAAQGDSKMSIPISDPGVYELTVRFSTNSQKLAIALSADDGTAVHCVEFPTSIENLSKSTAIHCDQGVLWYPSELQLEMRNVLNHLHDQATPVLRLLSWRNSLNSSEGNLQLWLESDAPACVSAISSIENRSTLQRFIGLPYDSGIEEYNSLFVAYPGGLVRVFRPGLLDYNKAER